MSSANSGNGTLGVASAPLSLRLILIFFSTAFLLVLTASGILYMGTLAALQGADDQVVDKRSGAIQSLLTERALNEGLLTHEVNDDNQGPRQIFIRVVTSAKEAAVETEGMTNKLPKQLFPLPGANTEPVRATLTTATGEIYRMASRRMKITGLAGSPDAVVQVATDTSLDQDSLAHFRRILLLVIGASLPLCALFSFVIVRREISPLAQIAAATRAIDASNIAERLRFEKLPAELHDLATQFNDMLARLETSWTNLEHYADTIAHEIRTPLNRMRLNSEIALGGGHTEADLRDVITVNVSECERLTRLLNGLLFLSRADNRHASLRAEPIDVSEQVHIVHEFFKADAAERGIEFIEQCAATPRVLVDRDLFKQALANLVSNALAHTPKGGTVTAGCEVQGGDVVVRVADTGTGISDEDKPRIFERFYRTAGRPHNHDGLGLGLAITKSITELHGGRISVVSAPQRGTTFTLVFPTAQTMVPQST